MPPKETAEDRRLLRMEWAVRALALSTDCDGILLHQRLDDFVATLAPLSTELWQALADLAPGLETLRSECVDIYVHARWPKARCKRLEQVATNIIETMGWALDPPPSFGAIYFPPNAFDAETTDHLRRAEWYSRWLLAMGEDPVFGEGGKAVETLRFLLFRAFHVPLLVRIAREPGISPQMSALSHHHDAGAQPGVVTLHRLEELTGDDFATVQGACARALERGRVERLVGRDGADWLIEVCGPSGYGVVDEWSPASGPIREAGLLFLSLAGFTGVGPVY